MDGALIVHSGMGVSDRQSSTCSCGVAVMFGERWITMEKQVEILACQK